MFTKDGDNIPTQRYLVPAHGSEPGVCETALAAVSVLIEQLEATEIIIVTPGRDNLREGTTIADALGDRATRALRNRQSIRFGGATMSAESTRTYRSFMGNNKIIFGVYLDERGLEIIDGTPNALAVVIVPWIMDEVANWGRRWDPTIIGEAEKVPAPTLDPLVIKVLETITQSVNLSTGLGHSSDKSKAVDIFKKLVRKGYTYNPEDVKNWAIQNGWSTRGAQQLYDVALGILEGRRLRVGRIGGFVPNIIEMLEEELRSENGG